MADIAVGKINKKQRNAALDLLRCIAMMMVVGLHFLGKGNLLPDMVKTESWNAVGITAWAMEAVFIVAVNVYMLISGYLLCESSFKLSRLISLYIQLWFYSVGVGAVAVATGLMPREELDIYTLLRLGLPVSMDHYWFMTAYVYFYLLLPLLGLAVRKMTEKQHRVTVILLLVAHCLVKSVLPVALETDKQGYDFMWYAVMFLVAAYIRLYSPKFMCKTGSIIMMLVGMGGSFAELMAIGKVGELTGKLEHIAFVSMHYNQIFPVLGAVGLFGLAVGIKSKGVDAVQVEEAPNNKDICSNKDSNNNVSASAENKDRSIGVFGRTVTAIAPYTLGVYLLHENLSVRYLWPSWFGCDKIDNVLKLVGTTLLAIITVFAVGIAVDFIRKLVFSLLNKGLKLIKPYRKLVEAVERIDMIFDKKSNYDK